MSKWLRRKYSHCTMMLIDGEKKHQIILQLLTIQGMVQYNILVKCGIQMQFLLWGWGGILNELIF